MATKPKSASKIISKIILWGSALFVTFVLLSILLGRVANALIDLFIALIAGWAIHLYRVAPKITYNPAMIASGIFALAAATYLLHKTLNWLHQQGSLKTPWSPRQTVALTTLILTLFGMSIAITGIIHQSAWIAKEDKIITSNRFSLRTQTINDSKNIHAAIFSFQYDNETTAPDLQSLITSGNIDDSKYLTYKNPNTNNRELWIYHPTNLFTANPELIILHTSTPAFGDRWIVLKASGSVTIMAQPDFQRAIKKDKILRNLSPTDTSPTPESSFPSQ